VDLACPPASRPRGWSPWGAPWPATTATVGRLSWIR